MAWLFQPGPLEHPSIARDPANPGMVGQVTGGRVAFEGETAAAAPLEMKRAGVRDSRSVTVSLRAFKLAILDSDISAPWRFSAAPRGLSARNAGQMAARVQ